MTNRPSAISAGGFFEGMDIVFVRRMVNMGNSIAKTGKKTAAMAVIRIKALYLQKNREERWI